MIVVWLLYGCYFYYAAVAAAIDCVAAVPLLLCPSLHQSIAPQVTLTGMPSYY